MHYEICGLIGHNRWCFRDDMQAAVRAAVEEAIHDGASIFLNLWQTGFDFLCALIIDSLKSRYLQIRQIKITDASCLGGGLENLFDFSFSSGIPLASVKDAVEWMIDVSGRAICFVEHDMGSTGDYLRRAEDRGLKIHRISLPRFYYRTFSDEF